MNKSAQFSSLDLVFALFAFMLVLVSLFFNYDSISDKIISDDISQDMNLILNYATESLIRTPGSPGNWDSLSNFNATSVNALGLSVRPGVLSENKINYLLSLTGDDYIESKTILGLLGPGYEFGFDIYFFNGSNYNVGGTFGRADTSQPHVAIAQRNFLIDNSTKAYARFYLTK